MSTTKLLFLAITSAALIVAVIAYMMAPDRSANAAFYLSSNAEVSPAVRAAVNIFGGDLFALAPNDVKGKSIKTKSLETLFMESNNPWNVSPTEFFVIRITYGFGGAALGILLMLLPTGLPIFASAIFALLLALVAYGMPVTAYRRVAEKRKSEFAYFLPEALDYLGMTMAGSKYSLPNAIELILTYMSPSAVRDEFQLVSDSIKSGMSTERALSNMADRVPDYGVQAFVLAMNNANKLDSPLNRILATRATASRKDLKLTVELAIKKMQSKIGMFVGIPSIISVIIISVAPSAEAIFRLL